MVEAEAAGIPPQFFFPDGAAEAVRSERWLFDTYAGEDGTIGLRVQPPCPDF